FNDHEIDALKLMTELLSPIQTLEVIHVVKEDAQAPEDRLNSWKAKAHDGFPAKEILVDEISVQMLGINSVAAVADDSNLDLMVFTRPQKPFFEKIFGTSLTKSVANYSIIPSLFIKS